MRKNVKNVPAAAAAEVKACAAVSAAQQHFIEQLTVTTKRRKKCFKKVFSFVRFPWIGKDLKVSTKLHRNQLLGSVTRWLDYFSTFGHLHQ